MKHRLSLAAALAALALSAPGVAHARPTYAICTGCHSFNGAVVVSPTLTSNDGVAAQYSVAISNASGNTGWAVFDGTTNIARGSGPNGSFSVPVGKTYAVWGIGTSSGGKSTPISPLAPPPPPPPPTGPETRVGGATRYEVAENLAKIVADSGDTTHAIIASGLDAKAVDALVAGGLSGVYRAPVLLVNGADANRRIPAATTRALNYLYDTSGNTTVTVHLVGGTASVPDWVRAKINAMPKADCADRVSGADRYSNAVAVARRVREVLHARGESTPTACFITNGESASWFSNALAASPVAAGSSHYPVLLTRATGGVSSTRSEANLYSSRYVVGSSSAVSAYLSDTYYAATRIGDSSDRSAVAASVATTAVANGWGVTNAYVGVANKLPDGLTGGAALGILGGPLLFTGTSSAGPAYGVPGATEVYLTGHASEVDTCYILGGTPSIYETTKTRISQLLSI